MTKFQEYDRALMDFIQETYDKLFQANDPILDMLELKQVENCGAVVSNTKGEQFESNPVKLKPSIEITEVN